MTALALLATACAGTTQDTADRSPTPSASTAPVSSAPRSAVPAPTPRAVPTPPPAAPESEAAAPAPATPAPETPPLPVPPQPIWSECGSLKCSFVTVPLDYDDPGGETITIKVSRARSTDLDARRGVLLVNPGGPGASGLGLAGVLAASEPELARHFDIVGWDPRGVGESATLTCDQPLQAFYRLDNDPDDAAERELLESAAEAAAEACAATSLALLSNIGTTSVVDDMESIRLALGEDTISYLGFSYGSMLGLVYATRYGGHLRAAVIDGVSDPAHSLEAWLESQAVAGDAAFTRFLDRCLECSPSASQALADAYTHAEAGTLQSGGQAVGPSDVARSAILANYSSIADRIPQWLSSAGVGDGSGVLSRSDTYLGLAGFDVYTAVRCLDATHLESNAAYAEFVERVRAKAPLLGVPVAMELLPCASWPVPSKPLQPISDITAPPMLILGNTSDAATPYADAVAVISRLSNAVLITYQGAGHLSFGRGSACVDDATLAYLIDLDLPEPELRCS